MVDSRRTDPGQPDIHSLQRRVRLISQDKKSYLEESTNILKQQRTTLERLKQENEKLKEDLALENRNSSELASQLNKGELVRLTNQLEIIRNSIQKYTARIQELETQSELYRKKIKETRSQMGGVNAAKENTQQVSKQIRILENRLDKALVKFNETLAQNRTLREEIDNLRRERSVFESIYANMEEELQEKKRKMAAYIERSNVAYEARDQVLAEIDSLKRAAERETKDFDALWRDLGDKMAEEARIGQNITAQINKRGNLSVDEEHALRANVNSGMWRQARNKVDQSTVQEKAQSYEQAFNKIQEATNIQSFDELVSTFINAEDQNFSLFKHANELNNEIDRLEEQIAESKRELGLTQSENQGSDDLEPQQSHILTALQLEQDRLKAQTEQFNTLHSDALQTLSGLFEKVKALYEALNCSTIDTSEVMQNQGVTEGTVAQLLGMIEERAKARLQEAHLPPTKDANATTQQAESTKARTGAARIEPPTTTEDADSGDDDDNANDDRPLSRAELKERAEAALRAGSAANSPSSSGKKKRRRPRPYLATV